MRFILPLLFLFSLYGNAQATLRVGEPAPPITVTHWLQNAPAAPNLAGRFVLLDFWATWCAPCLRAVPRLNAWQETLAAEGLTVLSLSDEAPEKIRPVTERAGFETLVATDVSAQTQVAYGDGRRGLASLPFSVLIDDQQVVRWFGSPDLLTEGMLRDFLAGRPLAQPQYLGTPSDRSMEILRQPSLSLSDFSDLRADTGMVWMLHLSEADDQPALSFFFPGTGGFSQSISVKELLRKLFPRRSFVLPESVAGRSFNFGYLDRHPTPDSDARLQAALVAYLGLRSESRTQRTTNYQLRVGRRADLTPDRRPLFSGDTTGPNGEQIFNQCTLPFLAQQLTQATDHYWYFADARAGKYSFTIDMTSTATIIASLKGYGITVTEQRGEREVVRLFD